MSLAEGYAVRLASTGDIDALVAHRRAMFVDMGYRDETALNAMAAKCHPWRMERGEYLAWLAAAPDHSIVDGAGPVSTTTQILGDNLFYGTISNTVPLLEVPPPAVVP